LYLGQVVYQAKCCHEVQKGDSSQQAEEILMTETLPAMIIKQAIFDNYKMTFNKLQHSSPTCTCIHH